MASIVYILGTLVTAICATLLLRRYAEVRLRLLLWSGLCFVGLTLSNALVFVDLEMTPDTDLYLLRLISAAGSMALLMYGLIWESE